MPQGKVIWAKKNHPKDDDQLHPDEARLVQARVSECNSNYLRFKMSAMNLLHMAPRDQIPPRNLTTYSRHRSRSNELILVHGQLSIAPPDAMLSREC